MNVQEPSFRNLSPPPQYLDISDNESDVFQETSCSQMR